MLRGYLLAEVLLAQTSTVSPELSPAVVSGLERLRAKGAALSKQDRVARLVRAFQSASDTAASSASLQMLPLPQALSQRLASAALGRIHRSARESEELRRE